MKYLGIDIGGTWIKGTVASDEFWPINNSNNIELNTSKVKSPLKEDATVNELIKSIKLLIKNLDVDDQEINAIGISTAGIVSYDGSKVIKAASHLNILKTNDWKIELEEAFDCKTIIINDADAASIGCAELSYLQGNKTIGIMPIGTGLGFSVWRNGRRWRPGKVLNLLGSIRTPAGLFDSIVSASKLAASDSENNLLNVLTQEGTKAHFDQYKRNLVDIINSAAILYNLDEVVICGGLADAAASISYYKTFEKDLQTLLNDVQPELDSAVKVIVAKEGNKLPLIGALTIAKGEAVARKTNVKLDFGKVQTEESYNKEICLEKLSTRDLLNELWMAEQKAGDNLYKSLDRTAEAVDIISKRISKGGRIIYVGAGTSGRVAAMDAVEISCTYGLEEDRILALIAGGVADASIAIEVDFEEDASAVPEIALMNINENDTVIGISASGTAYYVKSALAFAKSRNAYTIIIQNEDKQAPIPFYDILIPLLSEQEVVSGSTRMKAGTSTKKLLNFITSSVMIKQGKVKGTYMIDVACLNIKLVKRAQTILKNLYGLPDKDALSLLEKSNMSLKKAIEILNNQKS